MVLDLRTFTFIHVAISLGAIASGFVVLAGLLMARRRPGWTVLFLIATAATSVTGFLFPFERLLPSHAVGVVSLLVLPVTLAARYRRHLAGSWRSAYVVTAMILLYLNVFVLVAQAFSKLPALHDLAPTQSEPPFALAQAAVLVLFVAATLGAVARCRKETVGDSSRPAGTVRKAASATALTISGD